MRRTQDFTPDWRFFKGELTPEQAMEAAHGRRLCLPHDWSIEESYDPGMPKGAAQGFLPRWEVGWYKKAWEIDVLPSGPMRLDFDGVHSHCDVWVNGRHVGGHGYGYTPFSLDIKPAARVGHNEILVRVDNREVCADRWYSGAGIYRGVSVCALPASYLDDARVFLHSDVRPFEQAADLHANIPVINPEGMRVCLSLQERDGRELARKNVQAQENTRIDMRLEGIRTWSPESPCLYTARITLEPVADGTWSSVPMDEISLPIGFRSVELVPRRGLLLNGEAIKLRGVNLHHDGGCMGSAVPDAVWERRLCTLKGISVNAVRCSHNPPSAAFLSLCDRLGFLVIDEAFDKWTTCGYEGCFEGSWDTDLSAMLYRDRNHACVFLWSVGNEVDEQEEGTLYGYLERLTGRVRALDPTRPVTFALFPSSDEIPMERRVERIRALTKYVDIIACNYHEQWYEHYLRADPDLLLLGSETFMHYRGVEGACTDSFDERNPWLDVEASDSVVGAFIWSGIDYLGESIGWPSKGWSGAIVDRCGYRKSQSYYFESRWSKTPMVHGEIFDPTQPRGMEPPQWGCPTYVAHYTFPEQEDRMVAMNVFTNCEAVEVFRNGRSLGRKAVSGADRLRWNFRYRAGELNLVGYIGGERACMTCMRTAGAPARIHLDHDDGGEEPRDGIVHLTAQVVDADGTPVPRFADMLFFGISGDARILAVDNGDMFSDEGFHALRRSAKDGRVLAIVQSGTGRWRMTVRGKGLEEGIFEGMGKSTTPAMGGMTQ